MVNFAGLPTETLEQIWSLIQPGDVLSLAAVSKHIKKIGEEYIKKHKKRCKKYSLIRKTSASEDGSLNFGDMSYLVPPPLLLSTLHDIVKEPILAEYVKEVVIGCCKTSFEPARSPSKRRYWTQAYGGVLASVMHNCPYLSCREEAGGMTQEARRCIKSIEEGNEDVLIGLLLSLLPKIRTLRFQGGTPAIPNFCFQVINRIACDSTATALSHLTRLDIDFNWGAFILEKPLATLVTCAALPSLITLCARNIGRVTHNNSESPPTATSRVAELILDGISVDPKRLFDFLAIFKALQRFTYKQLDPQELKTPDFSPKDIIDSLLRCAKASLTHLTLYSRYSDRTWMGSLRAFTVLSHIHTDWRLVQDETNASDQQLVDNLPLIVQQVHLKVERRFDIKAASILIGNLALAKSSRFPALTDFLLLHMTKENANALRIRPYIKTAKTDGLAIWCDTTIDPDRTQLKMNDPDPRPRQFPNLDQHLSRLLES